MERFIKGDIVVLPFPYTDLSGQKKRPALVVADLKGDDLWLVQITSKNVRDSYAIQISGKDLTSGNFHYDSNIRPNKIFTLSKDIILYKVGHLNDEKIDAVENTIINICRSK